MTDHHLASADYDPFETVQDPRRPPAFRIGKAGVILLAVLALVTVASVVAVSRHSDASSPQAAEIAAVASAKSCAVSRFWIVRADKSHVPIWNCKMVTGARRCVTYENGIANDSTVVVRALFASSLSGRPSCAS